MRAGLMGCRNVKPKSEAPISARRVGASKVSGAGRIASRSATSAFTEEPPDPLPSPSCAWTAEYSESARWLATSHDQPRPSLVHQRILATATDLPRATTRLMPRAGEDRLAGLWQSGAHPLACSRCSACASWPGFRLPGKKRPQHRDPQLSVNCPARPGAVLRHVPGKHGGGAGLLGAAQHRLLARRHRGRGCTPSPRRLGSTVGFDPRGAQCAAESGEPGGGRTARQGVARLRLVHGGERIGWGLSAAILRKGRSSEQSEATQDRKQRMAHDGHFLRSAGSPGRAAEHDSECARRADRNPDGRDRAIK